jgi:hypothetical protein
LQCDDSPPHHGIKCLKQIHISKVNYELKQTRSSDRREEEEGEEEEKEKGEL